MALNLPEQTVKRVFAVFMIIVAVKMLFFDKKVAEKQTVTKLEKTSS